VSLCPLIKSSYGVAATDTCPFFAASDFLIGETTCDGKKKMFELMGRMKPLHLMHLPYTVDLESAVAHWYAEIMRLKGFLEEKTGVAVTPSSLNRQIGIHNRVKRLLSRFAATCADECVPISGLDAMVVMAGRNFSVDLEAYADLLERFVAEVEGTKNAGQSVCRPHAPRILLTGTPIGKGSDKVLRIIEASGGIAVCQENCSGVKNLHLLVEEDAEDPFMALARTTLRTPCACMSPNRDRLDLLGKLVDAFNIQGVVDLTWQCCHTYNAESYLVMESLESKHGVPVLHIETGYSPSDSEQLRTRIEAFLEMVLK
jgi:benzoyl-CoA reductase/2-hydroxyglutaryl-CoA dehydratase subunit BcrC/BadD/HgdB